jgi:hypothetical protein
VVTRAVLSTVLCLAASSALAACGDVPKGLFGIEIGGARDYTVNLRAGLSLSPMKAESTNAGVDFISGETNGIAFSSIQVFWHEDRVASITASALRPSQVSFDDDFATIRNLSGTDFTYNAYEDNFRLNCADGLTVVARKGKAFPAGKPEGLPVLVLLLEDARRKRRMQVEMFCKDKRQHCPYEVKQR